MTLENMKLMHKHCPQHLNKETTAYRNEKRQRNRGRGRQQDETHDTMLLSTMGPNAKDQTDATL